MSSSSGSEPLAHEWHVLYLSVPVELLYKVLSLPHKFYVAPVVCTQLIDDSEHEEEEDSLSEASQYEGQDIEQKAIRPHRVAGVDLYGHFEFSEDRDSMDLHSSYFEPMFVLSGFTDFTHQRLEGHYISYSSICFDDDKRGLVATLSAKTEAVEEGPMFNDKLEVDMVDAGGEPTYIRDLLLPGEGGFPRWLQILLYPVVRMTVVHTEGEEEQETERREELLGTPDAPCARLYGHNVQRSRNQCTVFTLSDFTEPATRQFEGRNVTYRDIRRMGNGNELEVTLETTAQGRGDQSAAAQLVQVYLPILLGDVGAQAQQLQEFEQWLDAISFAQKDRTWQSTTDDGEDVKMITRLRKAVQGAASAAAIAKYTTSTGVAQCVTSQTRLARAVAQLKELLPAGPMLLEDGAAADWGNLATATTAAVQAALHQALAAAAQATAEKRALQDKATVMAARENAEKAASQVALDLAQSTTAQARVEIATLQAALNQSQTDVQQAAESAAATGEELAAARRLVAHLAAQLDQVVASRDASAEVQAVMPIKSECVVIKQEEDAKGYGRHGAGLDIQVQQDSDMESGPLP